MSKLNEIQSRQTALKDHVSYGAQDAPHYDDYDETIYEYDDDEFSFDEETMISDEGTPLFYRFQRQNDHFYV